MNQKTLPLNDDAKRQIADAIPKALEKALDEYQKFIDENNHDNESKEYLAKTNAAKAALSHIELLLKLAAMVDVADEEEVSEISQRIHDAMKELREK